MALVWTASDQNLLMASTKHGVIFVEEGNRKVHVSLPWMAHVQVMSGTVSEAVRHADACLGRYQMRKAGALALFWCGNLHKDKDKECVSVAETPFGDVRICHRQHKHTSEPGYSAVFWGNESEVWAPTIQEAQEHANRAYLYVVTTEAEKLGLVTFSGVPAEPQ